jgi:hypothetical protein
MNKMMLTAKFVDNKITLVNKNAGNKDYDFIRGSLMDYLDWCYFCGLELGEITQIQALDETLEHISNPRLTTDFIRAMIKTIQEFDAEERCHCGSYKRASICHPDEDDEEVCHADVIVTQCQEEPKRIFH